MKKLLILSCLFVSIFAQSQVLTVLQYTRCDCVGFVVQFTHGNNIPDTCTWNVIYKADTCTLSNYDCDNLSDCITLGWKYSVYNTVADTCRIDLRKANKPVYFYAQGTPISSTGSYGKFKTYLLAVPKITPLLIANKYIRKGNKIMSTTYHDIYSFDKDYVDLSIKTVSPTITIPNDTTQMSCQNRITTMAWGRIVNDTLYWSYNVNWGAKSYRSQLIPILAPVTNTDPAYYQANDMTNRCACNGNSNKRWYTIVTGIVYSQQLSTWP